MPSLNSGSTSEGEGFSIPFKVIGAVGLILCAGGYVVYQYVRLHPAPKANTAVIKPKTPEDRKLAVFAKLGITDDQKKKLEVISNQTTDPAAIKRQANKLLTPEQKARAKNLRAEAQAARLARQQEQKKRQEQLYKGNNRDYAEAANKVVKQREAERRKAAAGGASPASTP